MANTTGVQNEILTSDERLRGLSHQFHIPNTPNEVIQLSVGADPKIKLRKDGELPSFNEVKATIEQAHNCFMLPEEEKIISLSLKSIIRWLS